MWRLREHYSAGFNIDCYELLVTVLMPKLAIKNCGSERWGLRSPVRLSSIVMKSWSQFVNFIEADHGGQLLDDQMEVN